jgi:hypothetical protein
MVNCAKKQPKTKQKLNCRSVTHLKFLIQICQYFAYDDRQQNAYDCTTTAMR